MTKSIKSLEKVIGLLSYCRRVISGVQNILSFTREMFCLAKSGPQSTLFWEETTNIVQEMLKKALWRCVALCLPDVKVKKYVLETD